MAKVNEFSPRIQMTAHGLQDYMKCLQKITEIPKDTLLEMVDSKAEVTEEAMVFTAGTELKTGPGGASGGNWGKYYTGDTARSVRRKRPRMNKRTGPYADITFEGTQHGNRNGEVAFVNEYGKKNQPARPFIRHALESSANESTTAAAKVLFDWQKKQGL